MSNPHLHGCKYEEVELIPGPQGIPGPRGEEGKQGPRGLNGRDGQPGPRGADGSEGPQGPRGFDGDRGPKGLEGCPGQDGKDGESPKVDCAQLADNQIQLIITNVGEPADVKTLTAPQGPQGEQGLQGKQGATGAQGVQGPQGVQGNDGPKGDQGDKGEKGDQGDTGPAGQNGQDGQDSLVACVDNAEDDTCVDLTFNTPTGQKTLTLQKCVSLLACGYTGGPICVTPSGTPIPDASSGETTVNFRHPDDTAMLVLQQTPGQAGTVSNITTSIEDGYSCVEWDQTGSFTFNVIVNTTGLPTATKDSIVCFPPVQPSLRLEAPQGVALNRKTGGSPLEGAWSGGTLSDGTVYEEMYNTPDYLQDFDEYVEGGVFSADFIGTGRMKVCYQHCYVTPVAAKTTISGRVQELCDPSGEIPTVTPVTLR